MYLFDSGLKDRQAKEIERLGEEHKTSVMNIEERLSKEKQEEMTKCKSYVICFK